MGFFVAIFAIFLFIKKNRYIISNKLQNQKRMKVSDVTLLGQGDRALILKIDEKDFLFISGKNSGALLTEIRSQKKLQKENLSDQKTNLKTNEIKNLIEKRIRDDQKV